MPEIAINRSWYILMFLLTFRLMTDNCCVLGLETGTPKLPSPQPKGKWIAIFFSKLNYSIYSRLPHFSIYLNFFEQCCYLQFFSPSSSSEQKFSLGYKRLEFQFAFTELRKKMRNTGMFSILRAICHQPTELWWAKAPSMRGTWGTIAMVIGKETL